MSITLEQLRTFALVAKHGSISRAAEERHLSQPALSAQLRQLTAAMGMPLYTRHRNGVHLTEEGLLLLPHAQAASRALQGARNLSQGVRQGEAGIVKIAASMTVAVYLLPPVLKAFREQMPSITIRLLTRNSHDAFELLLHGEADVALVEGLAPPRQTGLEARPLTSDQLVLAVLPDHPLASRSALEVSDLRGVELVQREHGSGTRELVELALAGLPANDLRVVMEATGIEAVKEAILSGLGAGFISRLAIRREVESGILVPIHVASPALQRKITLIHPVEGQRSRQCQRLIEFLHEVHSEE